MSACAALTAVLTLSNGGCSTDRPEPARTGHEFHLPDSAKVLAAARAELTRYPEATLLDLYKFFFQGAYGPGHMIPDADAAGRYLAMELHKPASPDSHSLYPIGLDSSYYRVGLSLVRSGEISETALLEAFVSSANTARTPDIDAWRRTWADIEKVLEHFRPAIDSFDAESAAINARLRSNDPVGHHSPRFREVYGPQYRVVGLEGIRGLGIRGLGKAGGR